MKNSLYPSSGMTISGADPEFPVGGTNQPSKGGGGTQTYQFAKFFEKLHEIEKVSGRRGGGGRACCDPLKSATVFALQTINNDHSAGNDRHLKVNDVITNVINITNCQH